MTGIPDELVEKACIAWAQAGGVTYSTVGEPFKDSWRRSATAALEAVGLPALLERVEAAEVERDEAALLLDLIHSEIGPAEEVWRWNDGTLRGRIHELINGGDPTRSTVTADRDALAAKVARVEALVESWSEPKDARSIVVRNHFDLGQTQGIDIGVDAVLADLRAALTEGTEG